MWKTERKRGRGSTNGAVHFKLHRISVHLIQRYWGLVLKQDSFNASSAGLIQLMNGPWKDQKEPFLVLKTARAGCLHTFYRNLVQSAANDCRPQCAGTRYSDICCGSMSVRLSLCLCFGFGTGQFGTQLPDTLRNLGVANRSLKRGWILFRWLVDGVVFCVAHAVVRT